MNYFKKTATKSYCGLRVLSNSTWIFEHFFGLRGNRCIEKKLLPSLNRYFPAVLRKPLLWLRTRMIQRHGMAINVDKTGSIVHQTLSPFTPINFLWLLLKSNFSVVLQGSLFFLYNFFYIMQHFLAVRSTTPFGGPTNLRHDYECDRLAGFGL